MAKLKITQHVIEIDDASDATLTAALFGHFGSPNPGLEQRPLDAVVLQPALPAPSEPLAKRRGGPRKDQLPPAPEAPREKRKYKKAHADAPAPVPAKEPSGYVTLGDRILAALKKKPMSSLELSRELRLDPPKIYSTASLLKTKGVIESKNDDEGDGTRRYFLVAK